MQKLYLTFLVLFLCNIGIHAQKLNVESFVAKTNDITARTHPRQDMNGNDCALVKVRLAADKASFIGNVIGNVSYDKSEYFVYMPHGSKRLTIKREGYLPLDVSFQEYSINSLEGKTVYVLTLSGATGTQQLEAPKTKTGWIILDSEPSGASVYINNEFVGNTPLSNYKQAYGTYQYRLENPNYHPATGTIELNAGRVEQKVVLKPAFGSISINSSIAGAKILLDGKQTGKQTPTTLTEIPSGSHTISLQLDKYAPKQQEVIVEDGQTVNVSMALDARFARITIKSLDEAEIYNNNKLIGKGRISEDMMEGYYDLEARLDHHKSVTKQIQVVAGQSQEITLNPIPKYGSLDVITDPHNAMVTIDGEKVGETPLTVDNLKEGNHQVITSLDGYTSETRNVTVVENQTLSVEIVLKRNNIKDMTLKELRAKLNEFIGNSKGLSVFLELQKSAALQGNEIAQNNLGNIYANGLGVVQDYNEALKWYRKAAKQGNAIAQYNIGVIFEKGLGAYQDYHEAETWYRKAAEQGYADAQISLGVIYYLGLGFAQYYNEAIKWFKKAAEQGNAIAQYNLGVMYYQGCGVTKDYDEAVKWFKKAAKQGNQDALKELEELKKLGYQ